MLVSGWRQSHLYFHHHRRRLLRAMSLPPHLEAYAQVDIRPPRPAADRRVRLDTAPTGAAGAAHV